MGAGPLACLAAPFCSRCETPLPSLTYWILGFRKDLTHFFSQTAAVPCVTGVRRAFPQRQQLRADAGRLRTATAAALCARPPPRLTELENWLDAAIDAAIRSLNIFEYEYENEDDQLLACAPEDTTVLVAADTGAVDHVIPIGALEAGRRGKPRGSRRAGDRNR